MYMYNMNQFEINHSFIHPYICHRYNVVHHIYLRDLLHIMHIHIVIQGKHLVQEPPDPTGPMLGQVSQGKMVPVTPGLRPRYDLTTND